MNQKIIAFLILTSVSLFLFNASNALIVYLRPPKMIIRFNTSDTVERSLVVENRNNISMNINATMNGNITDVITIKNPAFEIFPNETKNIDFVTSTKNPGVYSGLILVTYTTEETEPITLQADITVVATEKPKKNMEIPILPISITILILIIVVSIFLLKRGRR